MIQNFPTGIGNYRESLIKALAELKSDHRFVLIGNVGNKMEAWAENQPQFKFVAIKSKPNSLHQHFLLPFELAPLKLDLFWTTPWGASVFLRGKYTLTIYDLLYRRYPEIASLKARLYDIFFSKWVARRAEIIFTISEFVKSDIEEFLGIKKDKIVNIRGAAGDAYQPFGDNDIKGFALAALQQRGIQRPYFVYLGNFRPHKNLQTLLAAFAKIKDQRSKIKKRFARSLWEGTTQISNLKLVLVGAVDAKGRSIDSQNLFNLLKELKLQKDVILTGRISDDREVAEILNEALALVHPSYHEGFGLTVLEAMACGCPVIAATTTSIPEVVGDAGILIDPRNVDELAEAMGQVLAGEHPELVQKGLAQAKKFSWQKTAKQVLNTIESIKFNPTG